MNIPLVDLKTQYLNIKDEIDAALARVLDRTAFISGPFAAEFEADFAAYIGRRHCLGVANGTDALAVALKALDLEPEDEVIVPALTFIATSEAVTMAGARVIFADVDPQTRCLDPEAVAGAITARTKVIMPVHLHGRPADMAALGALAAEHGLTLIEDAAQAQGAKVDGSRAGALGGLIGCYSFYPGKNLGAYGDAGGIVCDDDDIARKMRIIANHGAADKYGHVTEGVNSRMDGFQAAVLKVKLAHLDNWNQARRTAAAGYNDRLAGMPVETPADGPGHIYHVYAIETEGRDELLAHLRNNGVGAGIHYPDALPRLKAYERLGHRPGDFPAAETLAASMISLPIFPEITPEQQDHVAATIKEFFDAR